MLPEDIEKQAKETYEKHIKMLPSNLEQPDWEELDESTKLAWAASANQITIDISGNPAPQITRQQHF